MKPKLKFSEPEIKNVVEGYYQFLEGKTISNLQANKQFKKWLSEKMK